MADLPEYVFGIPAGMGMKRRKHLDAVDRKRQKSRRSGIPDINSRGNHIGRDIGKKNRIFYDSKGNQA